MRGYIFTHPWLVEYAAKTPTTQDPQDGNYQQSGVSGAPSAWSALQCVLCILSESCSRNAAPGKEKSGHAGRAEHASVGVVRYITVHPSQGEIIKAAPCNIPNDGLDLRWEKKQRDGILSAWKL